MKKFLRPALSVVTSLTLLAMPFSVVAYDDIQETGISDMSDEQIVFGEFDCSSLEFTDAPDILSYNGEDGWLLGNYLDANNTAVYAQLTKLVTPSMDDITIKLPEPVTFTTTTPLTSSDTALYNAVFGACSSAINAVSFDMPEIFWLDQNQIAVSPNSMPYTYNRRNKTYTYTLQSLTITPAYYSGFSDFDEVIEYKEILDNAIADFVVEGDTTVEKLKSIHDQITTFTYYDLSAQFSGSALGSLVTSGSVCESYSKGFKLICDRENIPCVCVFGNYNADNRTAHMWNYVLMEDNCWYAVDVTWDDKDGKDNLEFVDTYFMKGSADFYKNHTPCESYSVVNLRYPELAEWNYGENPAFTTTAATTTSTTTSTTTTSTATMSTATTSTTTMSTTTMTTTTTVTTSATTTTVAPEFEYGDLNHDGKVSVADLVYCSYHVLGVEPAEYSCDLNSDNRIDVFDVIIMRGIIGEIITAKFNALK